MGEIIGGLFLLGIILLLLYLIPLLLLFFFGLSTVVQVSTYALMFFSILFIADIIISASKAPLARFLHYRSEKKRERSHFKQTAAIMAGTGREALINHISTIRNVSYIADKSKNNRNVVTSINSSLDSIIANPSIDIKLIKSPEIQADIELIIERLSENGLHDDMVVKRMKRQLHVK